jgi:hypothetical protein
MTRLCCPTCRLRFTRAATAFLVACPECGEPPQSVSCAQQMIGLRLFEPDVVWDVRPDAVAVAMPLHPPFERP